MAKYSLNLEALKKLSREEIVATFSHDKSLLNIVLKATGKTEQKAEKVDKKLDKPNK